jgi:hypothetical protein
MRWHIRLLCVGLLATASGCFYVGEATVVPERLVAVVDDTGTPLINYDMYIYRCTQPGSQFDKLFSFPNQQSPEFRLAKQSAPKMKRAGGVLLAPDFYISHEPQPYWVACVEKQGYASRRWSLGDEKEGAEAQGSAKVVLSKAPDAGPDLCKPTNKKCDPCRSYEYFMYQTMRYRHSDCEGTFD